jgi:hypothetical protein
MINFNYFLNLIQNLISILILNQIYFDCETDKTAREMSKPILYFHLWSSPARATYFLAKFIGLDFEEREVKLFDGETFTEEYRKVRLQKGRP